MSAQLEELRPTRGDGSLMRTFIGAYLRELGGWVAVSDLVTLLGELGVSGASVRTNLSRLKAKGLLLPDRRGGAAGYRLADDARDMLERGDRRIYGYRQMQAGDPWMIVVFSVPERHRDLRHQLRARLTWLGCAAITPGAWVGPGHLLEETTQVLSEVGLLGYATLLRAEQPCVEGELADAVARWWDLPGLGARYDAFLEAFTPLAERWRAHTSEALGGAASFVDYLRMVDAWRAIPYLDPALPRQLLPPDWPGERGVTLFAELRERLGTASASHVMAVAGGHLVAR